MNLTIAHIYYDLLNLYGENGNIKVLKNQLELLGIKVTVKYLSINDNLEFDNYDIVYMGFGTEENQALALKHLYKYKDDIKRNIENNKFYLITGNSIELFGKCINEQDSLNIFNYITKTTDQIADEAIFKTKLINKYVIGFQNQRSYIENIEYPLFNVIKGYGSNSSKSEGIHYKNFYGTYLIGPLLARNPFFLKFLIKEITKKYKFKVTLKPLNLRLDIKAYNTYLDTYFPNY